MPEPQTVRGFIVARLPFGNTSLIVRCLTRRSGPAHPHGQGRHAAQEPGSPACSTFFYLA